MAAAIPPTAPIAARPPGRGRRIPGLALIRSTHGLQRVMLIIGLSLIALFIFVALTASVLAPYDFAQTRAGEELFPTQAPPSSVHWLGTTVAGMDVLSRILYGAQTALLVVVLAACLSIFVGVPLGVVSGYVGGILDRVLVLITDALYAFPSLLLAIVVSIMVSSGRSDAFGGIVAAAVSITVIFIPQYFRVVRNATLAAKAEPYVDAARVAGARPTRIMFGHILSNVSQTIPVLATLNASEAILTLAGLGFLGFGIEPSAAAEWGYDLNKALADVSNGIWWTGVFPGLAIVLVVTGVALIGESLNDVLNPLLRIRGGATTADEVELEAVLADTVADHRPDAPQVDSGGAR
ncbi:MAG: ABC transporter permease [Bifidobacteriaceae bacterium]|jgi:peptide/nickel transport system permease protein|nr:ABC transporter permease [Bifidobacteriaceae bacterium]